MAIFLEGGSPPLAAASGRRTGTAPPGAALNRPTFDDDARVAAQPPGGPHLAVQGHLAELPEGGGPKPVTVMWGRLGFAALFVFGIMGVGIVASIYHLDAWSTALLHSFETLTGVAVGLLGGEAASKLG